MEFELKPNDSHKSFYGKCIVDRENGTYYLKSYNTIVASFSGGKLKRHWGGWSATTQRHVNAFVDFCRIENAGGKAWWLSLPVEKDHYLTDLIMDFNSKYGNLGRETA